MDEKGKKCNRLYGWYSEYKIDIQKVIFSFLMAYSSVIVVIVIFLLNNQKLNEILVREAILFSILGCCSSLLAVGSVKVVNNEMSFKLPPFLYNFLIIIPIFGYMSYSKADNIINIPLLISFTIMGVFLSFYYVVLSTNEERNTRKKMEKESKDLRESSQNLSEAEIGGEKVKV